MASKGSSPRSPGRHTRVSLVQSGTWDPSANRSCFGRRLAARRHFSLLVERCPERTTRRWPAILSKGPSSYSWPSVLLARRPHQAVCPRLYWSSSPPALLLSPASPGPSGFVRPGDFLGCILLTNYRFIDRLPIYYSILWARALGVHGHSQAGWRKVCPSESAGQACLFGTSVKSDGLPWCYRGGFLPWHSGRRRGSIPQGGTRIFLGYSKATHHTRKMPEMPRHCSRLDPGIWQQQALALATPHPAGSWNCVFNRITYNLYIYFYFYTIRFWYWIGQKFKDKEGLWSVCKFFSNWIVLVGMRTPSRKYLSHSSALELCWK